MTEPVRFEAEEITPKESGRGMLVESAPFVASVERLMIRVRSANLKDHGQMLAVRISRITARCSIISKLG